MDEAPPPVTDESVTVPVVLLDRLLQALGASTAASVEQTAAIASQTTEIRAMAAKVDSVLVELSSPKPNGAIEMAKEAVRTFADPKVLVLLIPLLGYVTCSEYRTMTPATAAEPTAAAPAEGTP